VHSGAKKISRGFVIRVSSILRKFPATRREFWLKAGIVLPLALLASAVYAPTAIAQDPPLDYSNAPVCPDGYFYQVQVMRYLSNLWPIGMSPKQSEITLAIVCPSPPAGYVPDARVSCPAGEPEPIRMKVLASGAGEQYACICDGAPWGQKTAYYGDLPKSCRDWRALSVAQQKKRQQLLRQRIEYLTTKVDDRVSVIAVGAKGFAMRAWREDQSSTIPMDRLPPGEDELKRVIRDLPPGCDNVRPARFLPTEDGFVFDCDVPAN
jgi:hypothetical protein